MDSALVLSGSSSLCPAGMGWEQAGRDVDSAFAYGSAALNNPRFSVQSKLSLLAFAHATPLVSSPPSLPGYFLVILKDTAMISTTSS